MLDYLGVLGLGGFPEPYCPFAEDTESAGVGGGFVPPPPLPVRSGPDLRRQPRLRVCSVAFSGSKFQESALMSTPCACSSCPEGPISDELDSRLSALIGALASVDEGLCPDLGFSEATGLTAASEFLAGDDAERLTLAAGTEGRCPTPAAVAIGGGAPVSAAVSVGGAGPRRSALLTSRTLSSGTTSGCKPRTRRKVGFLCFENADSTTLNDGLPGAVTIHEFRSRHFKRGGSRQVKAKHSKVHEFCPEHFCWMDPEAASAYARMSAMELDWRVNGTDRPMRWPTVVRGDCVLQYTPYGDDETDAEGEPRLHILERRQPSRLPVETLGPPHEAKVLFPKAILTDKARPPGPERPPAGVVRSPKAGNLLSERFIADTGCGYDLVDSGSVLSAHLTGKLKVLNTPVELATANGTTVADRYIPLHIPQFPEKVNALLLEKTPNVISIGLRCMEHGYSFIWKPHKTRSSSRQKENVSIALLIVTYRICYLNLKLFLPCLPDPRT